MKLVVIESPYAGEVDKNVEYARKCIKDALGRGEAPIASHLLYTQPGILDDTIAEERALGIGAGLAWAYAAEYAVFYVDRGVSNGMLFAHDFYIKHKKPIMYRSLTCDIPKAINNLKDISKKF